MEEEKEVEMMEWLASQTREQQSTSVEEEVGSTTCLKTWWCRKGERGRVERRDRDLTELTGVV